MKELHKYCQKEDGTNDEDKTRELVWFMQLNFSCTLKQATTEITRFVKDKVYQVFFFFWDSAIFYQMHTFFSFGMTDWDSTFLWMNRSRNSTKRHFFIKPDAYEHIDHKVIGLLHERGGKMYMAECQWTEAYVAFCAAFTNYCKTTTRDKVCFLSSSHLSICFLSLFLFLFIGLCFLSFVFYKRFDLLASMMGSNLAPFDMLISE